MILEQKLIEKQKNKKNVIKENEEKEQDKEEEKKKNQSYIDSWKENKENNIKYKKPKYKSHNYNNNYNHSNKYFHYNKNHFKDFKKQSYNQKSNRNNYNNNNKVNYIEKEIEFNSKEEVNAEQHTQDNSPTYSDSNSKNNLDNNSQENAEEINTLEYPLLKLQSMKLSDNNILDYHEIGIKLFPGAIKFNKMKSYEQNNYIHNINDNININNKFEKNISNLEIIKRKDDLECDNYLCKTNSSNIKSNQKNGLALAFDYYASVLEDKIK